MVSSIEEIKKIIEKNKITGVDEAFEKVSEEARNIPNIKDKIRQVFIARGQVLELSTIIEVSFNELLSNVCDERNPEKDDFMPKAKRVEELMLRDFSDISKEQFEMFQDFVSLRNIFAHVPINWFSQELEFNCEGYYERYFKRNVKWKEFSFAINYFANICNNTIELIKNFVKLFVAKRRLTEEINKALFGDIPKEMIDKIMDFAEKQGHPDLNFGNENK